MIGVSALHWILFRSRPTVAPWPATILDLARAIERNNSAAGATGMMLFSNAGYLHYLEAEPGALEDIWVRIRADNRHKLVWSLPGETESRRFTGLPMGYFDVDHEHSRVQATPIWHDRHDWRPDQTEALIEMLQTIAREKYPAAMNGGAPG
jgi:hypothetical protein